MNRIMEGVTAMDNAEPYDLITVLLRQRQSPFDHQADGFECDRFERASCEIGRVRRCHRGFYGRTAETGFEAG